MLKQPMIWTLIAVLVLLTAACAGSSNSAAPADGSANIDAPGLFAARCAGCHGSDRSGRSGPALLPERLTKDRSAYVDIITNGKGPMPAWGSQLSADQINALVDYIMSAP